MPSGDGWAFELKWDGMRVVAHIVDGDLTLRTTNLLDATARFPELDALVDEYGAHDLVLDGEVVALGDDGRPSFAVLQRRMHLTDAREVAERAAEIPVGYQIFDLLHFDGHDTLALPFRDRRRLLEQLIEDGPSWRLTSVHDDGEALLDVVRENDLEGLVAKRWDSSYRPGGRSPAWRKVKLRKEQEFVVGGFTEGDGGRSGTVGALMVGYWDDGALHYAGRVGSGFSDAELKRLLALLTDIATAEDPFAGGVPAEVRRKQPRFVHPAIVVQVAFTEWHGDGNLRHPVYLGQRTDVDASAVGRDP